MTSSASAGEQDPVLVRHRLRRLLLIGVGLTLPRFALAFLAGPATDAAQIVTVLLLVVGLVMVAASIIRLWLLRSDRVLPVALAGVAALIVAAAVVALRPPGADQVAYEGGLLAPLPAVAFSLFYLLVGAVSQLGLFVVLGSAGAAVTRALARRAAR